MKETHTVYEARPEQPVLLPDGWMAVYVDAAAPSGYRETPVTALAAFDVGRRFAGWLVAKIASDGQLVALASDPGFVGAARGRSDRDDLIAQAKSQVTLRRETELNNFRRFLDGTAPNLNGGQSAKEK